MKFIEQDSPLSKAPDKSPKGGADSKKREKDKGSKAQTENDSQGAENRESGCDKRPLSVPLSLPLQQTDLSSADALAQALTERVRYFQTGGQREREVVRGGRERERGEGKRETERV